MKKYSIGLIFLFFSMVWGMESTEIESKKIESVVLTNFTHINNNACCAVIKFMLFPMLSEVTLFDDDGFASLALIVRMMESNYSDKNLLVKLVDIILPVLIEKVNKDPSYSISEEKLQNILNTWSNDALTSDEKWKALKDFVFDNRNKFCYAMYTIFTNSNEPQWNDPHIEAIGLVAKDKNTNPPQLIISLKEPINLSSNDEAALNIQSWMVDIEKSVDAKSDSLAEIALMHTHRYFAKDGGRKFTYDSAEFMLVFNALKSIAKAMPAFSIFNQGYSDSYGHSTIALLPALNIENMISSGDKLIIQNNFAIFFDHPHYEIAYLGINSLIQDEKTRKENIKETNEMIKWQNEQRKSMDPNYTEMAPLSLEYSKDEIKKIDDRNNEIKGLSVGWTKPALSSPLNFVYMFAWNGSLSGFSSYRYWVIEVKPIDDSRAQVTVKTQLGKRPGMEFLKIILPKLKISLEDLARSL